jgi:hypothetical protein
MEKKNSENSPAVAIFSIYEIASATRTRCQKN